MKSVRREKVKRGAVLPASSCLFSSTLIPIPTTSLDSNLLRLYQYPYSRIIVSMARQLPSLHISQIIASDALLSPVASEAPWDPAFSPPAEQFSYNYFMSADSSAAASPVQPNKALKMRMSPDNAQEQESLCMPTHQVFELSNPQPPSAPAAPPAPRLAPLKHAALQRCDTEEFETSSTASKRSASPAVGANKKRATGERISSKDFVPPDVTGLSKREARLVKNRAAAFLSRQRKREEFETMEMYVIQVQLPLFYSLPNVHRCDVLDASPNWSRRMRGSSHLPKAVHARLSPRFSNPIPPCSQKSSNSVPALPPLRSVNAISPNSSAPPPPRLPLCQSRSKRPRALSLHRLVLLPLHQRTKRQPALD